MFTDVDVADVLTATCRESQLAISKQQTAKLTKRSQ
jgi:hypothetical protein